MKEEEMKEEEENKISDTCNLQKQRDKRRDQQASYHITATNSARIFWERFVIHSNDEKNYKYFVSNTTLCTYKK